MDSSQSTPRALATSTRPRGGRNAQRARLGLACIVEDVAERRHRRRVGLRVVLEKGVIDLRSEHGRACFCRRRFDTNSRGSDQRCDSPLLAWKVGSRAAGWSSSSSDSAKTAVTSITPLGPAAPPGGAASGCEAACIMTCGRTTERSAMRKFVFSLAFRILPNNSLSRDWRACEKITRVLPTIPRTALGRGLARTGTNTGKKNPSGGDDDPARLPAKRVPSYPHTQRKTSGSRAKYPLQRGGKKSQEGCRRAGEAKGPKPGEVLPRLSGFLSGRVNPRCWGEPRRDCVSCSHSRLEVPRQAKANHGWAPHS